MEIQRKDQTISKDRQVWEITNKKEGKKKKKPEVVKENPTESKLRANGCNNSHHCWLNNVGRCCVRLHVAKSLTGFKLWTTTPNNAQQHATGRANGSNM